MNSADQPHAVMSADHTDLADREDHSGRAWTAPSQDPAAPAGPPDSVTGPVVPTATASGTHQPLTRTSLAGGLLHQWQQRNLAASLPLALRQLEDAGNLDNVRLAIQAGRAAERKNGGRRRRGKQRRRRLRRAGRAPPGRGRPGRPAARDRLPRTGVHGLRHLQAMEAVGWELAHGRRPGDPELTSFASEVIALLEEAQRPDGYLNSYFQVSGEPRYTRLA